MPFFGHLLAPSFQKSVGWANFISTGPGGVHKVAGGEKRKKFPATLTSIEQKKNIFHILKNFCSIFFRFGFKNENKTSDLEKTKNN